MDEDQESEPAPKQSEDNVADPDQAAVVGLTRLISKPCTHDVIENCTHNPNECQNVVGTAAGKPIAASNQRVLQGIELGKWRSPWGRMSNL